LNYFIAGIGSALLLVLSLWVVVPAPTRAFLPLAVGAPEISPWLILGNLLFVLGGLLTLSPGWGSRLIVAASCLALSLSLVPLSQFSAANRAAHQALVQVVGADYAAADPAALSPILQGKLRPRPFVLADSFRGIAIAPVRETAGILFAKPDGVPLTLDLYQPSQPPGLYPAIVMIYGGAWQTGSPADNAPFARYMANQGYNVPGGHAGSDGGALWGGFP
jgi:hypothetical protein